MNNYAVLIPAYKPVRELFIPFVKSLRFAFSCIVVVDDGSGAEYDDVFAECVGEGAVLLRHKSNLGKGCALKTGILYIDKSMPFVDGVVTADCDGQHSVKDIFAAAKALEEYPDRMIIGGRAFDKNVPSRSRIGNTITRFLFRLATGIRIHDTQTGLRAFSRQLFERLEALKGERYEYEMNMLLSLREWGVSPFEIPIETIYINENSGSHYNPVRDSLRVGGRVMLFLCASLTSFVVDYLLYLVLSNVAGLSSAFSFGAARFASAMVNYLINRNIVFGGKGGKGSAVKYFLLAGTVLLLGMSVMRLNDSLLLPLFSNSLVIKYEPLVMKAVYDSVMYFVNYVIQRDYVFKVNPDKNN